MADNMYRLELVLKDKIPNDAGQITIPVNGIGKKFRYQPVEDGDTGQLTVALGQLTDRVSMLYAEAPEHPLPVEDFAKVIAGKDAALKNDTFVAGYVPALRNQLEEIRSQDELIRLQQFGR